jgi:hypothetical protein
MFPFNSPEFELDLAHQRAADLRREAAAYRFGRSASAGRRTRAGRRARAPHHAPATTTG